MNPADPIERIPQKKPFLFLDKVLERSDNEIVAITRVDPEDEYFKGHFPGNPVMPGVLLCEACFQAGALLMSYKESDFRDKMAVVSRIQNAKFKRITKPGDELVIKVKLQEVLENAAYMKGVVTVDNKKALILDFAVTLVGKE